ncbi:alpha-amylase family glycosyl hydrolase [Pseudaeromonas paramecii]|uniref:alpha-amylase family glycosyl hydrolase n=1 Tax=Pseudaeromonas paramecii TaxID=2138166 RepID=UPI0031E4F0FD
MRLLLPLTLLLLGSCASAPPTAPETLSSSALPSQDLSPVAQQIPARTLPTDWARGAVFMEIYVRGFQDSNGDGIGDFRGLISRLDYLQDLGIQGLWLMPVNQSKDRDHGYGVVNYRDVEADYGSRADFQALLEAAHARGMGIIMDYVINHSSDANPLFADAKANRNGKRDWYIWAERDPYWVNWARQPSWHRTQVGRGDYYYGVFWVDMPDFNLRNPQVLAFHHDNLRYWMNQGVDGFRIDAVGQLIENGPQAYESQPENKPILKDLQTLVHSYPGNFMVCEEPTDPVGAAGRDACGSSFAFGFNRQVRASVKHGKVTKHLSEILQQYPLADMGLVLGSHDSYAGERLMVDLAGDEAAYRLAAATQLTLPGQPFIYYGEEIGMGTSRGNAGDWGLRAPMSWQADGGFSTVTPFRAPADNQADYNAADQQAEPDSLWHHYQQLIALRKAHPALRLGDLQLLAEGPVLAYLRQSGDERVLVVLNYSRQAQALSLPLKSEAPQRLLGQGTLNAGQTLQLRLPAQGLAIYRL